MIMSDIWVDDWMMSCSLPTEVAPLAAPSSVSMRSVDMTHVLRWRPPAAACGTALLYSVQFQG